MSVVVVTDTTVSLSPEQAGHWRIRLVPLTVIVAGRPFRDTELDPSTLLDARVTTAGPPPSEFLAALQDAADGVVIVTVAASLSSTYAAARLAAAQSATPVEVVDSTSAAGGQALVVMAAADHAAEGGSLSEVAAAARSAARQVRLVGCLDSLDGLAGSGRVPAIAALATRKAGLQFLFALEGGSISPLRPARSREAALDRIVAMCRGPRGSVADVVVHGEASGLQQRLVLAVDSGRLVINRKIVSAFTTAITVRTGPGVAGMAWRFYNVDRQHPC